MNLNIYVKSQQTRNKDGRWTTGVKITCMTDSNSYSCFCSRSSAPGLLGYGFNNCAPNDTLFDLTDAFIWIVQNIREYLAWWHFLLVVLCISIIMYREKHWLNVKWMEVNFYSQATADNIHPLPHLHYILTFAASDWSWPEDQTIHPYLILITWPFIEWCKSLVEFFGNNIWRY